MPEAGKGKGKGFGPLHSATPTQRIRLPQRRFPLFPHSIASSSTASKFGSQAEEMAASLSSSSSSLLSSSSIDSKAFLPQRAKPTPNSLKTFSLTLTSQLATLPILSFSGDPVGETYIDLKSAPPSTARAVVHRAIITDLQNKRRGTASTLTRGEVRGGGKKPYAQKKTGHARRGSQTTPLRPGGGVIFGPKPCDWSIKINRKEKRLAISTALSTAAENMVVVEDFRDKFEKPRTSEFTSAMRRWGVDPKEKSMFLLMEVEDNVRLSSRNIGTLKMLTPRSLNLFDILNADKLVLTPGSVDFLNGRYGVDTAEEEDVESEEVEGEEG